MKKGKIAVEGNLTNIVEDLMANGYNVVDIESGQLGDVEAVVVSGVDNNFMGIANVDTEAPVIIAEGLSAEEVRARITGTTQKIKY